MIVSDSYIRAYTLIGFDDLVWQAGGDPLALLDEAGIDRRVLQDIDGVISFRKATQLFEIAARRLDRPSIALEWTLRSQAHFPQLGPLVLLARFVGTVEEWSVMALKYWRVHTNGFTVQIIPDLQSGRVACRYQCDSFVLPSRQWCEGTLGNLVTILRNITGHTDENPLLVRFQHSRPRSTAVHEQVFRCPVEFDAEHSELVAELKVLGYRTNGNLRLFKSLVGLYMQHRIERMPAHDSSMTTTVALAIPSILATGHCGIDFIAESLGLHTKRLQRMLAEEGTTFSDILDKVRENTARRLLVESNAPVERIAGLLDYSTTAPFTTAFKRWTGQTPLVFRRTERERLGELGDKTLRPPGTTEGYQKA